MTEQDELKIHVQMNTHYRVLDRSGNLPFGLIFGLCRRSPQDIDPRHIIIDTAKSVFDVPYALARGLIKAFEGPEEIEVDLSSLKAQPGPHRYIVLPPVRQRQRTPLKEYKIFLGEINSEGDFVRFLKNNTKYVLRLASTELGVHWWKYSDSRENSTEMSSQDGKMSETTKLVNSKVHGRPFFSVCDSLPCPPDLEIHLRLQASTVTKEDHTSQHPATLSCTLEVSITNTNPQKAISIQSSGHQRFLHPWGPFQPLLPDDDRRRLTSTTSKSSSNLGKQNFIIHSNYDNTIVRQTKSPVCLGLIPATTDRRPTRSDFATLLPGEPLVQVFDLDDLLVGALKLEDGEYGIEVESVGAWWCWGDVDKMFEDEFGGEGGLGEESGDEKIPVDVYDPSRPPIWLKTEDKVVVKVVDGKTLCEFE